MFTGLIQSTGVFHSRNLSGRAGKLRVRTARAFPDLQMGESIAVNGVCLTLEKDLGGNLLEFHVMEESFRRTNLGNLNAGDLVNLERALAVGDRLGGHIVSGHVDGTGTVLSLGKNGDDTELKVAVSPGGARTDGAEGKHRHRRNFPDGGGARRGLVYGLHHSDDMA